MAHKQITESIFAARGVLFLLFLLLPRCGCARSVPMLFECAVKLERM